MGVVAVAVSVDGEVAIVVVREADEGTGKGIEKLWIICAEIDERIWITLVGIIVGAC